MTKFSFVIPLRSKAASRKFDRVERDLDRTLRSVLAQDDPDFEVLLVCHDIPDILTLSDPRVRVIQAEHPVPKTRMEQLDDKQAKKRLGSVAVRDAGGGYVMYLDADDLVSRRLVSQTRRGAPGFGYIFDTGYVLNLLSHRYRKLPELGWSRYKFHEKCGSCAIFRFAPDDLPSSIDAPWGAVADRFKNHSTWPLVAAEMGKAFDPLPFPGAVHLIFTGENHSVDSTKGMDLALKLRERISGRSVGPAFAQEFFGAD